MYSGHRMKVTIGIWCDEMSTESVKHTMILEVYKQLEEQLQMKSTMNHNRTSR